MVFYEATYHCVMLFVIFSHPYVRHLFGRRRPVCLALVEEGLTGVKIGVGQYVALFQKILANWSCVAAVVPGVHPSKQVRS